MTRADLRRLLRLEQQRAQSCLALGMTPEAETHTAEAARLSALLTNG